MRVKLLLLILSAAINVLLAYGFGHEGYEAFVVTLILLGLLASWQAVETVRFIFASKINTVAKVFQTLATAFLWYMVIGGVMLSVSRDAYGSDFRPPQVSWLIVAAGVVPFVISQLLTPHEKPNSQQLITGWVTNIYAAAVLFIGGLGYHNRQNIFAGIVLVIAMQLQYLMSYLATQTDYLEQAYRYASRLHSRNSYAVVGIVGAPFIVPLLIILIITAFGK